MSKREYAIFVDGPSAGSVIRRPGAPDFLDVIQVAQIATPVARYDASDLISMAPLSRVYYRALRQPLPFGYVPYMVSEAGFTSKHSEAATRMIELLVEQGHAESTKSLVDGYRRTTSLLTQRLEGLERRLSAVIANYGLSDVNDEVGDDDE